MTRDALVLRLEAIEQRVEGVERAVATNRLVMFVLAGLVVAAVVVLGVEIGRVYHVMESQQWRSR